MPRKRKRWWQKLRPKRVRAGVHLGIAHAEAEWEKPVPKPRKRRATTKSPAPTRIVRQPTSLSQPQVESRDPLDQFLADAQNHLSAQASKSLKRKRYDDAVVQAIVATGIHRIRKKPPPDGRK